MKEYSVYEPSSGLIVYSGLCQDEVFESIDNAIEGAFDGGMYYVKNGTACLYPPSPSLYHVWNNAVEEWVETPEAISEAKQIVSSSLDLSCKTSIISGFYSNALGLEYYYPSKETDQANLNASVTASMYPGLPLFWTTPFWCERDGQWRYQMHTAAQIQQVGFDGKNAVLSFLAKNASLQEQLANAQTIEDIMAVQW